MLPAVARTRNKTYYRVLHVPIWIWVFFILPGGLTADLYAHGFDRRHAVWLALVAAVCIWRASLGRLPGTETKPYITHYGLKWPNLPYRVVCYSAAWIAVVVPWLLNLIGLVIAAISGHWVLLQLYGATYDLLVAGIVLLAALNYLPRARRSIYNEGAERAWFYVGVWTALISQPVAWAMWRLISSGGHGLAWLRLGVFLTVSAAVFVLGLQGKLPRTTRFYVPRGGLRRAESE